MGIQIERIRLHQLRHAAGALLRDQLRAHLRARDHPGGGDRRTAISGWGEVTCGENPFYNEEWTEAAWMLLNELRRAPRAGPGHCERGRGRRSLTRRHPGPPHGARRTGSRGLGPGSAAARAFRCGKHIGGGARKEIPCGVSIGIQDSVAQLLEKIRTRGGGRLSAHQDEDQAGLGRRRGPRGARASSRPSG